MKQIERYLTLLVIFITCCMMVSCGGDDDDNNIQNETNNNEESSQNQLLSVPEHIKPFVGNWRLESSRYYYFPNITLFLFQDGYCYITISSNQGGRNAGMVEWNYDEETKILATLGTYSYQWEVTAITENAWTSKALWGDCTYSAIRRTELRENLGILLNRNWVNSEDNTNTLKIKDTNGKIKYYSSYLDSNVTLYDNSNGYLDNKVVYVEDKEKDMITISKQWNSYGENDFKYVYDYNVEIVHPYSYKDVYLNVNIIHANEELKGKFIPE